MCYTNKSAISDCTFVELSTLISEYSFQGPFPDLQPHPPQHFFSNLPYLIVLLLTFPHIISECSFKGPFPDPQPHPLIFSKNVEIFTSICRYIMSVCQIFLANSLESQNGPLMKLYLGTSQNDDADYGNNDSNAILIHM